MSDEPVIKGSIFPDDRNPSVHVRHYVKKPIVIEAALWDGHPKTYAELLPWFGQSFEISENRIIIKTLEGDMYAEPGDYIIKGVAGELYPCKPEIFAESYEVIESV